MKYFVDAFSWLLDSAHHSGANGIWARLAEHFVYSLSAVLLASLIAIPLGWCIGHCHIGRSAVITLSGMTRSLPTLGLITLLALALGIGLIAPLIAFVILAIPSILAGAYTGVESAPADIVDAAKASGMSGWQILFQVQVPLGLELLIGGVRAAFVQVVATATLAAYVGAGGLGRFIFLGLRTQDYPQMLGASFLVVALTLVCDLIFAAIQRLAAPRRHSA